LSREAIDLKTRLIFNRSILAKSITTTLFAIMLWYRKAQELLGVPNTLAYFLVRHSFDIGLSIALILLALLGLYVSFSPKDVSRLKAVFMITGCSVWTAYSVLFLLRDLLFPHFPSLEGVLILAIAISYFIDLLAKDF